MSFSSAVGLLVAGLSHAPALGFSNIGIDDGSDYVSKKPGHIWFERVPDDAPVPGTMTGHWLDTALKQDNAACLDGTAPLYYHRPGTGTGKDKWYIHHEGGGWCYNLDSCLGRSQGALGSTNPAKSKDGKTANMEGGYFSTNPTINPQMYNWNAVFLRYCDGGSFSGSNATSTVVSNTTLWFRGKHVLKAMMGDLVGNRGLAAGTDVVVSGCSAGGLATFLHIDHWATVLSTEAPKAKVRGLPDSGFFLDREAGAKYHSNMIWVFDWMNSTSGVNDACISANAGSEWKCIFAEHTSPHIKTPIFPLQGEYDSWQMCCDLGIATNDPKLYPTINEWGANLTALVLSNLLGPNPAHGIFLDSCLHHCGGWGSYTIDGMVQGPAFEKWYETGTGGVHIQGKAFPCTTCCTAPETSSSAPPLPTFTQTVYDHGNDACDKAGPKTVTKIALSTSTSQHCVEVDNWGKVIATCTAGHSPAGNRSWALGECVQGFGKSWMYTDCQGTPLAVPHEL